ncbi:MAG TPA: PEP-utilizing enzyme, partial [Chloroflexota bacterium]|nr:PEP-utilizing enzyme [Chloroflexota bacterium]
AAGALLHRALMAAGRRLAGAGAIPEAADVRWLRLHEITAALQGLEGAPQATPALPAGAPAGAPAAPSGGGRPAWASLVEARRELHAWQRSLTPPAWAGAPPPAAPAVAPAAAPGAEQGGPAETRPPAPPEAIVQGQPGSAGTATGRVRLVPRDAQVPQVAPGDVLVARNAGALWTPVFPVAAAVVLEEGSLLQHAMLTCREYRVPGVYQAREATTRLQEGQRVTVDGANGWVLPAPEEGTDT